MTAAVTILALTSCSNPTGGTAALGTASLGTASVDSAVGQPSGPGASSPSAQLTTPLPTPVVTTLTVTAAPPAVSTTAAPPVGPTTAPAAPAPPPTDLSGEVHGFVTAVDVGASRITVDKVDWFTGAAAQQACAEDGITSTDDNRCTGYYFRNVNPMLRVLAVSPQASIVTLANSVNPVASDLTTLAGRVAATNGSGLYDFTVANGVVTDLRELYFP